MINVKMRSQPPSLENPFVGVYSIKNLISDARKCLNLQAWRIPLWVYLTINLKAYTCPVSTSKPGESLCGLKNLRKIKYTVMCLNLQAWRIPLWAAVTMNDHEHVTSLNLQAWRIPLWVFIVSRAVQEACPSQPPSLENPFVGVYCVPCGTGNTPVSTSKPGESLCGRLLG